MVIVHNLYAPFHYSKAIVRESDLDQIENTFILNEVKLEDLKLDMSIKEVMKLKFIDLYNNEWIEFINSGYDNFINFRNDIKKIELVVLKKYYRLLSKYFNYKKQKD